MDGYSCNLILGALLKPVEKYRAWLQSGENIGHSSRRLEYVCDNMCQNSFWREKGCI